MSIEEYIKNWNEIEGVKPSNNAEFINDFIDHMRSSDKDYYSFSGENGYCGNTALLMHCPVNFSFGRSIMDFEFAYGDGFVKVFTAHNEGFWVPEYISVTDEGANEMLDILKRKCLEWAGFNNL